MELKHHEGHLKGEEKKNNQKSYLIKIFSVKVYKRTFNL